MFEIIDQPTQKGAVIKVIGVGGCGGNAVEHMIARGLLDVEFICANTDAQALKRSTARVQVQLGTALTRGLGAGARPEIGRAAAMQERDRIGAMIEGTDMLFNTAGTGGRAGPLAIDAAAGQVLPVTVPASAVGQLDRVYSALLAVTFATVLVGFLLAMSGGAARVALGLLLVTAGGPLGWWAARTAIQRWEKP